MAAARLQLVQIAMYTAVDAFAVGKSEYMTCSSLLKDITYG